MEEKIPILRSYHHTRRERAQYHLTILPSYHQTERRSHLTAWPPSIELRYVNRSHTPEICYLNSHSVRYVFFSIGLGYAFSIGLGYVFSIGLGYFFDRFRVRFSIGLAYFFHRFRVQCTFFSIGLGCVLFFDRFRVFFRSV